MKKRTIIVTAAVATLTAATLTTTAHADQPTGLEATRAALIGNVDPQIIDAMRHDFGLTTDGVYDRLAVDTITADIADIAPTRYGDAYAGTWVNDDGTGAVVAVTDPALAGDVTALGATPRLVDHSLDELTADLEALDAVTDIPTGVSTWAVDITTNTVTVTATTRTAGQDFLDAADVTGTVHIDSEQPRTYADIVGGDAYYINGAARCSIGFPINYPGGSGFVSAGHCGSAGDSVSSANQSPMGTFQASTFPGSDYSWVAANSNWTSVPRVNGYGSGDITVTDGDEAPTGATVCRSGSTTGLHCGTIGAKNQTVFYPQGVVYGMTQTDVCAEPGDSGGSWITGGSAQGVTSGGSGNCTSGGVTYFFPLTTILDDYQQLTLTTA